MIGGGIAGLATAALLGADGWDVTVLEARDELGGRAGSWEQDGFRFDTGPSWYLMPEVFEHFFRLLGTTAERELDLVPLDPAYRVYIAEPATALPPARRAVGSAMPPPRCSRGSSRERARSCDATSTPRPTRTTSRSTRFLYDTYETTAGLRDPALLRRRRQLAPLLTRSLAATSSGGSPIRGCARSSATRPSSSAARRTTCRASTT